jgi:hypothetical protein
VLISVDILRAGVVAVNKNRKISLDFSILRTLNAEGVFNERKWNKQGGKQ